MQVGRLEVVINLGRRGFSARPFLRHEIRFFFTDDGFQRHR